MKRLTPYDQLYAVNMLRIAAEANAEPAWADYAAYCSYRADGLRRDAFTALGRLLSNAQQWSTDEKRRFVVWLASLEGEGDFIPYPLATRLYQPTLREWHSASPTDPEPLILMGNVESRWAAWELAPADPRVCVAFVERVVPFLEYSAHELPLGWVGDLDYDRPLLADAKAALALCPPSASTVSLQKRLESVAAALAKHLGESA